MKQLTSIIYFVLNQDQNTCQSGKGPSPTNLIEGKNVIKDKFADSVNVKLNWPFGLDDPTSTFNISYTNGSGTIKIPLKWLTTISYKGLTENSAIEEDQQPQEIRFKYPSENVITKYGVTTLNRLEMQIVHTKKKPAKDLTEDFPSNHSNFNKLIISVPFEVMDSLNFKTSRNGDPFLYSIGISAKFLDKEGTFENNKWQDFSLNPAIDWDRNKTYGDIHPDYKKLLTNSQDKQSYRQLIELLGFDTQSYMYYGSSTDAGSTTTQCKEDTLYIIYKNSRLISIEQDILLKLLLLKNEGNPKLSTVGYKNIPDISKTKGNDSISISTDNFLNFDSNKKDPKFNVEQLKSIDQAEIGTYWDIGNAINIGYDYYKTLEVK